ncbi:MAG: ATP-dependent helicase UvrD/PcrA, partial [Patescibacteria group bacterium]|nr:ATP-dependent helicase UvrD/PcrA [Patescibacteria group bacterium]
AQKKAVDTIEGPVMVIAGPGTGKTSILTLRIANILRKTDTAPENILALTFTESGAYAMRKKLVSIIGTAGYKVNINTFHGFCNEVIKQYPERFPRIIGSMAITDIDQIAVMEKIIESTELELLKPYGDVFFYVKPALGEIRNLKREAIGTEDFAKIIKRQEKDFNDEPEKVHEKGAHKGKMKGEFIKQKERIEKNKELLKLYEAYEKALVKEKFYDFEDMIVEVIKTLKKDEDLLLMLQESYQYIMADEHQDANNAQNSILELLSNFHENPNLFIVGDEKQAIFRFQGAELENFFHFRELYKGAVLIDLEENYRSTQPILDASHSLISNNTMPKGHERVILKSKAEKGTEPVRIVECATFGTEASFLIKDIQARIKTGTKPDEIAILYRDNKDAFPIAHAFEKTSIPFRIESDNDILKDEHIRKLLIIFEAINDLAAEETLGMSLFVDFFGLEAIEIYKVFEQSRKEKRQLIDVITEKFPAISKKLSSWAHIAHNKTFIEVFEIIVRESGYLEFALSSIDSLERMATLEAFFGELRKLAGARKEYYLKDFIEHLTRVREHGILTKTGKGILKEGVRLMTAHKSKGLEFDFVYIVGAFDGHWGNKTRRTFFKTIANTETGIDDERRLFYVALTRARKEVTITYAKENHDGKELLPAQFISEISDEHKKVESADAVNDTPLHFKESVVHEHHEIKNKEYLQQLFLEQGLSVTALNNYLKCPWEYFFVNLVRLPKAQSKHQMYGTAMHETLKTFFDKYREEQDMSKKELIELFEFNARKTLLSPLDLAESLKKGKEALEGYFEAYKGSWNRHLLTEYSIRGVHLPVGDFELLLKGNLDKVEILNDRDVNVVDYKTGKRKSENKENYVRQLTFYKLLLNLDEKKKYVMKSGELDFIEADDKGKQKKDVFDISDAQVEELIALIKEKAQEIYSLSFWNKKCDEKDCEYCKLGKIL